jgi:hypothetical protein
MTFTWTRDGERVTSTCAVCLARVSSRQEPVIRAWQRTHDPVACRRGRNRAVEGPRSDAGAETVLAPTPTPARPVEAGIRFTQPNQEEDA